MNTNNLRPILCIAILFASGVIPASAEDEVVVVANTDHSSTDKPILVTTSILNLSGNEINIPSRFSINLENAILLEYYDSERKAWVVLRGATSPAHALTFTRLLGDVPLATNSFLVLPNVFYSLAQLIPGKEYSFRVAIPNENMGYFHSNEFSLRVVENKEKSFFLINRELVYSIIDEPLDPSDEKLTEDMMKALQSKETSLDISWRDAFEAIIAMRKLMIEIPSRKSLKGNLEQLRMNPAFASARSAALKILDCDSLWIRQMGNQINAMLRSLSGDYDASNMFAIEMMKGMATYRNKKAMGDMSSWKEFIVDNMRNEQKLKTR